MPNVEPIPRGRHTVIANLTIRDCSKAIEFYKRGLGMTEAGRAMAPDGKSVWHAELNLGDSTVYVNDAMQGSPVQAPTAGQQLPVTFWVAAKDCDAAYRKAIEAGAKSMMEPQDMFWGDRVAEVADPFGYRWSFTTHVKDMTPDEMKKAGEEFAKRMRQG